MSENISPYGAAKFVNEKLAEAGVAKPIPPQMMYNYTTQRVNAGKAPFIKWDSKTGEDPVDLERWTVAYVATRVAKETPTVADPEQAEFDQSEAS